MKLYLAGPMRGYAEFNFPAFHAAAAKLRLAGHNVFNPAENDKDMEAAGIELTIRSCLGQDLAWICAEAEGVALLPGWERSTGATAEAATGRAIGAEVKPVESFL